jgi:rod shape-determining protein MreC
MLAVSLVSLAVTGPNVDFKPKEMGMSVLSIFQIAAYETSSFLRRTVTSISELRRLQTEYDRLQEKMNSYQLIEQDILELKLENESLRELLEFSETLDFGHVPAAIIGKDPGNFFDSITINKGSNHGVARNMAVVASAGGYQGLVGRIVHVSALSSIVMPIYSIDSFVAARLQGTRHEGLVTGTGNATGNIYMRHVVKRAREDISYGDIVISSGLGPVYPKGIYVGRVRSIGAKEWEPSLELEIEPIVDFSRLEYVFVLSREG